jgi:hypothetical protein
MGPCSYFGLLRPCLDEQSVQGRVVHAKRKRIGEIPTLRPLDGYIDDRNARSACFVQQANNVLLTGFAGLVGVAPDRNPAAPEGRPVGLGGGPSTARRCSDDTIREERLSGVGSFLTLDDTRTGTAVLFASASRR